MVYYALMLTFVNKSRLCALDEVFKQAQKSCYLEFKCSYKLKSVVYKTFNKTSVLHRYAR